MMFVGSNICLASIILLTKMFIVSVTASFPVFVSTRPCIIIDDRRVHFPLLGIFCPYLTVGFLLYNASRLPNFQYLPSSRPKKKSHVNYDREYTVKNMKMQCLPPSNF